MASVAVIGLGSIGSIFAAHLIAARRHNVVCCVRSPVQRIVIEGVYGSVEVQPSCLLNVAQAKPVDWILLATKSQDTPAVAPWLARLCGPATRLAVLQNGVDQQSRVAPFSHADVLPTVVYANGKKLAPQHIRHLCPDRDLIVPDTATGREIVQLFEGSRLVVETSPDFLNDSWRKFLANIVANPLTAITGRSIEVLRGVEMEHLALVLLKEAVAVGSASGAALPADAAEQTLQWMSRYPGSTGTSMLQDRLDGRPLEYEALTGNVIRLGERFNIPTPMNRAIRAILQATKI